MMMEASPAPTLVMSEPNLLLKILIVPLDPPAQLGHGDKMASVVVLGSVESQYLTGSASPFGHSMSNHSRGHYPESFRRGGG